MNELQEKEQKLEFLLARKKFEESLPHLYGFPFYVWARKFFDSRNRFNILCSGNQISKSSTQIRKCIHWATDQDLWKQLWKSKPHQFWYLYPSSDVADLEFHNKWIDFLPKDEMKDHPIYGWEKQNRNGQIHSINFKSGISIYFKTYSQDRNDLQGATVHAIFCDEEPPQDLIDELLMRMIAVDGYFHAVFTPTIGQEFWREAVEEEGKNRRFPTSFRQQVSMYDCLKYEDGGETPWSVDKIRRIEAQCKSDAEVQRRVYGRFVLDTGLKYPAFARSKNVIDPQKVPSDWRVYVGVDPGSGGENHPAAICFVAVSPEFTKGFIFKGCRLDGVVTTNSDIVQLVDRMCIEDGIVPDAIYYDFASADMGTISGRMGKPFLPAEKSHAIGEQYINVLFKNKILWGFRTDELDSLYFELQSVKLDTSKKHAKDDFCDALRYAVSKIPWDWSVINPSVLETLEKPETETDLRRKKFLVYEEFKTDIMEEIEEWNSLYG